MNKIILKGENTNTNDIAKFPAFREMEGLAHPASVLRDGASPWENHHLAGAVSLDT